MVAAVMVIGNIVTVATIDKFGRRVLLLISSFFICLSMASVGAFFHLVETQGQDSLLVKQLGWLPLASFIIFIFVFSIGLGPVPWVLLVELMPLESMVIFLDTLMEQWALTNSMELCSGHCLLHSHQYWLVGHLWCGLPGPSSKRVSDFVVHQ